MNPDDSIHAQKERALVERTGTAPHPRTESPRARLYPRRGWQRERLAGHRTPRRHLAAAGRRAAGRSWVTHGAERGGRCLPTASAPRSLVGHPGSRGRCESRARTARRRPRLPRALLASRRGEYGASSPSKLGDALGVARRAAGEGRASRRGRAPGGRTGKGAAWGWAGPPSSQGCSPIGRAALTCASRSLGALHP